MLAQTENPLHRTAPGNPDEGLLDNNILKRPGAPLVSC